MSRQQATLQAVKVGILADLFDLVLPAECVCCRRPGSLWCAACRPPPSVISTSLGDGPAVCSAGRYDGSLRTALLAYKERGYRRLAPALSQYLGHAVSGLILATGRTVSAPLLVPVPSRPRAARERGGDHVLRMAVMIARRRDLEVRPALRLIGPVADSAGLSTSERQANLSHRMVARLPPPGSPNPTVILVDDIITTGATTTEASRAMAAAGWQVVGAATIAATVRRWPRDAGRRRTVSGADIAPP